MSDSQIECWDHPAMRHKTRLHTHAIRQSLVARWRHATAGMLGLALAACSPASDTAADSLAAQPAKADTVSVMVDSVNYRHDREIKYELYDLSHTGSRPVGGSIVSPLTSGGNKGCCLNLPSQWRPGLKLRVTWGEATKEILRDRFERTLDIPRYEQPSDLYVVFYPSHEVEVVVSVGEPGHPTWAGRIKQTPWQFCVAQHGRKECSAANPDPILQSLKESCPHVPEEPACKSYLDYCKSNPDEGGCP